MSNCKCQVKPTCQGRHPSSNKVKSQTWRARLHGGPRRKPRAVDQPIEFSAAAGVAAHGVVLVEIYLAGVHHFPARGRSKLKEHPRIQEKWVLNLLNNPHRGLFDTKAHWSLLWRIQDPKGRYCILTRYIDSKSEQEQVQTRRESEKSPSAALWPVICSCYHNNAPHRLPLECLGKPLHGSTRHNCKLYEVAHDVDYIRRRYFKTDTLTPMWPSD